MLKRKEAQIYLIAALIIVGIIAAMATIVNYALRHPEPVKFYDLSQEFRAESSKVVDYGVYSEDNPEEIKTKIDTFSAQFLEKAKESDPKLGFVYVYGNETEVHVANFGTEPAGITSSTAPDSETDLAGVSALSISKIKLIAGQQEFSRSVSEKMEYFKKVRTDILSPGDWVKVNLGGALYHFDLDPDEDFYFVIETTTETLEGIKIEDHIVSNENSPTA